MPDRKPLVIDRRMAGDDHAVVTVSGGGQRYRRRVCSDCPWRKDAVGIFPAEAFRHSANTGTDGARLSDAASVDGALHTFACHQAGTEKPATCAGYILKGDDGIGWRIAVATGKFDPRQVRAGGAALFDSYFDMAVANGVPAGDPALDGCRPWDSRAPRRSSLANAPTARRESENA